MIELVQKYYKAWETKDLELLNEVLHPEMHGIRMFNKDKFYENDKFIEYFNNTSFTSVTPSLFKENGVHVTVLVTYSSIAEDNEVQLDNCLARFTMKEDKIFKVIEEIPLEARRFMCTVSYDGSSFSGFQRQLNEPSIQETIESAIKAAFKQGDISIHPSGRTDKGVHAVNQVFHFDLETKIKPEKITMVLNSKLPKSIHIKNTIEIDITMHSRYDAKEKTYLYKINTSEYDTIQRNYEWYVNGIDVEIFESELKEIIGTHNFQTFTKTTDKSCVRTIKEAYIIKENSHLNIYIKGNGFLRYMVRNIVGALAKISTGNRSESMKELLEAKDVTLINDKAPASGLYLYDVKY